MQVDYTETERERETDTKTRRHKEIETETEIENQFQNLARTFVTPLGDFYTFFGVMSLEADTVYINNATHPSRPG